MNPTDVSTPSAGQTAGQLLRTARERQGMHLALLSVNLKVSVAQLEALEADRYEAFKGTAFVRALALSVCRQLKIDPTAVMAALPQGHVPARLEPAALQGQERTQRPPRASGGGRVRTPAALSKGLNRQVLLLAVLMLLGAAVLIWWPEPQAQKTEVSEPAPELQPAPMPMVEASDVVPMPATAVQAPVMAPAATAAPLPASAAGATAAVAAVPRVEAPVRAPSANNDAGASPLLLQLTSDAWVSVRDKAREVVLKRQVKAGETVELAVEAPFFVYVSRADAVQVRWQGQRVDLQPHTQNNEVRLSIKP